MYKCINVVQSYTVTGCAVAQRCCKGDQSFQWEALNFDPHISQTPQFFHAKICTDDYVWHISECAKFGMEKLRGLGNMGGGS